MNYWALHKRPTGMVAAFFDNMEDSASDQSPVFRWGSSPLLHRFNEETLSVDENKGNDKDEEPLRPQHECPWCAINPWDGLLYTSTFNPPYDAARDVSYLYRYDIHNRTDLTFQQLRALKFPYHVAFFLWPMLSISGWTASFTPPSLPVYTFAGVFPVKGRLTRIQGGCFSQEGSLFLASDGENTEEAKYPGIWRVSMLNGHVLDRVGVNREYDHDWGLFHDWKVQEVEGVCLHSSHKGSTSGPDSGPIPQTDKHICTGVWGGEKGKANDRVFFKTMGIP